MIEQSFFMVLVHTPFSILVWCLLHPINMPCLLYSYHMLFPKQKALVLAINMLLFPSNVDTTFTQLHGCFMCITFFPFLDYLQMKGVGLEVNNVIVKCEFFIFCVCLTCTGWLYKLWLYHIYLYFIVVSGQRQWSRTFVAWLIHIFWSYYELWTTTCL